MGRLRRVFLNIAYDNDFRPLCLAYIVGLTASRLTPVLALPVTSGETCIDKIYSLLASCAYPITIFPASSRRGRNDSRFNMPFELGMAVAHAGHAPERFTWIGFDSKRYQASRTLSDLAGSEFVTHSDRPGR